MKLKILPPSLREDKRYLAFEVISQKPLEREELIFMIWGACLKFHGECETSKFQLWLTRYWDLNSKVKNNGPYIIKGILQCKRGYEDKIRGALTLLTNSDGKRLVFHTRGKSGTIKSLTKKFIKLDNNIN